MARRVVSSKGPRARAECIATVDMLVSAAFMIHDDECVAPTPVNFPTPDCFGSNVCYFKRAGFPMRARFIVNVAWRDDCGDPKHKDRSKSILKDYPVYGLAEYGLACRFFSD